mgnify:CR=1 FL=1|jgi:hypothetical protein
MDLMSTWHSSRVSLALTVLVLAAVLTTGSGCIFLENGGSTVDGGYAPVIEGFFPGDPASQLVTMDSFLSFSAAGSDQDSLFLEWDWQLDGELQALGNSEDGSFDTTLDVPWTAELSGLFSELLFTVSDGNYDTELYWSVTFE